MYTYNKNLIFVIKQIYFPKMKNRNKKEKKEIEENKMNIDYDVIITSTIEKF